jgi:CheY-like chemotaxis protein
MAQKPTKRVLVVEDSTNWQELLCNLLEEVAKEQEWTIQSTVAISSGEALEQITAGPFDFVTLDNQLVDGENAKMLLERIFKLGWKTPVVVVSGAVQPDDVRDFFKDYGVDEFFWKDGFNHAKFKRLVVEHMPDELTWLHLSDLHFEDSVQREFQIAEITDAVIDDLSYMMTNNVGRPSKIFFTGDLAHRAHEKEFAKSLEQCFGKILTACNLQASDFYIIPGNHDVNRTQTTPLDAGIIGRLNSAAEVYALLHDPAQAGYRQQLMQRMDNYQSALQLISDSPNNVEALSWGRSFKTNAGRRVGVVGLNSAWTSASVRGEDGEVDDQGKLLIGKPQILDALKDLEQETLKPRVVIALMHHPIDWLQDWDQRDVKQILREQCQFVLHGHVHETAIGFLGSPSPTTMVITAGTLFKKSTLGDRSTSLHAYNMVQLDLASQRGRIYFRQFNPVHRRYGIDDTTFKDVRNGCYSFRYGNDGFRPDNGNVG